MSLLPQRKKSAEELDQLRDQLGISPQPAPPASSTPEPTASSPASGESATLPAAPVHPTPSAKPVRSLRRSEREPAQPRPKAQNPSPQFSRIPAVRHSSGQLAEIHRRDTLSQFNASKAPALFPFPAPHWVLAPGYLLALAGFSCQYWQQDIPLAATAGTAGLALLIALYILLRRPLSRHHAGFIAIITLFALVFATLHYFPYLRHAS